MCMWHWHVMRSRVYTVRARSLWCVQRAFRTHVAQCSIYWKAQQNMGSAASRIAAESTLHAPQTERTHGIHA